MSEFPYDDAYIHFRIARNFSEFGLPFFNISEPIFSTSSPIWTLTLKIVFGIFGAKIIVVRVLSGLLVILGSFLLYRTLRARNVNVNNSIFAAVAVYTVGLMSTAVGLMETSLWYVSLVGVVWLFDRQKLFLVGVLAALMVGMRYEFVVLLFLLTIICRKSFRFFVGAAVGGLVLITYLWYYFGAFVPQTVKAKSIVYGASGFDTYRGYFENNVLWFNFPFSVGVGLLLFLWSGYILFGASRPISKAIGGFGLLLGILYGARGAFMFQWYWALVLTPMILALAIDQVDPKSSRFQKRIVALLMLLTFARPIVMAFKDIYAVTSQQYELSRDFIQNVRVQTYAQLGSELGESSSAVTSIVASEIGALSWAFPGSVLDGVGLVSPGALKYHPMKVPEQRSAEALGAIPAGFVREHEAKWIVSMPILMEEVAKESLAGQLPYRKERGIPVFSGGKLPENTRMPKDLWGNAEIEVWVRD